MLKRIIVIILILMLVFLSTSCINKANDENATIQIWSYDFENASAYSDAITAILSNAKIFCDKNGIPLDIIRYNEKDISQDDYILKRNAAAANGNLIIIEDANYINDLAKQHADYTKLDNYNKLLDVYKDRFCIPLGVGHLVKYKYNDAINYYNISTDKPLITYDEYLEIKQQMKEKGANFKLNYWEFQQLVDYFLIKNNLKYINEDSEILKDNNNFEKSLKNAIIELCDDFKLYNNNILNADIRYTDSNNSSFNKNDYTIYDKNSDLTLCDFPGSYLLTYYSSYATSDSILDRTFVMDPDAFISPCFFMYKKITNDKIYDLANYIVSENSYMSVVGVKGYYFYSPVFNEKKTKEIFELNDNWQYEGTYKTRTEQGGSDVEKKMYALYNEIYEMLVRNDEKSNLLASYYFTNKEYSNKIYDFIADIIIELSNRDYDYKNEETNKMIDNKIDEFITNFNVHYK